MRPRSEAIAMPRVWVTVLLLVGSNFFMTVAWYGHLKFQGDPTDERPAWALAKILPVILLSWLIALPEYMLQVPANRIGHVNFGGPLSAPQLKVIQEAITLVVFLLFTTLFLKERLRVNEAIAFGLIFLAVLIAMAGRGAPLAK
jgi:uncharacterized protein (DUF486 family)